MTSPSLRLPHYLDCVHERIHAAPILGHLPGDFWLPHSAQQRVALAEALMATDQYIADRLELERKARWAGIRRNARRTTYGRKIFALCVGFLKYGFVKPTFKSRGWDILATVVAMFLIAWAYKSTTTVSLPESSRISESQSALSELAIPDPKRLTDSSLEPGLPLKLSCDFPSYQSKLKVKP